MIDFTTSLFPWQEEAVKKLGGLKVGALYMEMGTGKTRTALELSMKRIGLGKCEHILWLCPCSVKQNLKMDILYHCGSIPHEITIRGIESISGSDRLYLELSDLVHNHECFLIVDESNLVKNPLAKRSERIYQLSLCCKYKLILNGTPVSRNEADMYEQWRILDWRILGYKSFYSFSANHIEYKTVKLPNGTKVTTDQVSRILNKDYLVKKIAPYVYQISKEECNLNLPEKIYHTRHFGLPDLHTAIYEDTRYRYLENVDELKSETIYKLFTALQHVASGRNVVSTPDEPMQTKDIYASWEDNPRVKCFKEIIVSEICKEKCVVFAKYASEISEIEHLLDSLWITCVEFTGRVSQKIRQENLQKFRGGAQILVANKMCGAYGLNLQFCHNVIFYSNDFDMATRKQAEDRVHRIGQVCPVNIYDVIADGTIDDFIQDNLSGKSSMIDSFKHLINVWKNEISR